MQRLSSFVQSRWRAAAETVPVDDPCDAAGDPAICDRTGVRGGPDGICLYRTASSGRLYVFANGQGGAVGQWRLDDDGSGGADALSYLQ